MWKKTGGVWAVTESWSKVWKRVSGVWGKAYSRALQLYTLGVQNVVWNNTPNSRTTVNWLADHVYTSVVGWHSNEGNESTQNYIYPYYRIDVTAYTKLCIDWDLTFTGNANNCLYFGLYDSVPNAGLPSLGVSISRSGGFTRKITIIDITSATGMWYPQIYMSADGNVSTTSINMYNMWLE